MKAGIHHPPFGPLVPVRKKIVFFVQPPDFNQCAFKITLVKIVEGIKTYLKSNFNKPISFSDIASQYNFSPAYLTKIFKEYAGTSPIKYLQKYRIDVARKLLWSSNLSVKEIAEKVGFEDQFHFSKNFKNVVGVSPQQFRSKISNSDD